MEGGGVVEKAYQVMNSGFFDYRNSFADVPMMFTIVGVIVFVVNSLAFLPESYELISNRTNYGLSSLFIFGNSIGQFLLIINFMCLNYTEFCGIFNHPFKVSLPSLVTFFSLFGQWFCFLPCVFLTIVLDDREHMEGMTPKERFRAKLNVIGLVILNVVCSFALLSIWAFLGHKLEFSASLIHHFGEFCGLLSSFLEVLQAIPQIITTIQIRGNGSLSLLMLEIQGPSALLSALYMALALKESFTTYLTVLIEGTSQLTLLTLCLFFKFCKYIQKGQTDYSTMQMTLLKPIDPVLLV